MQGMEQQNEGATAPVPVEQVLATIRAAMSHVREEREPAEQMLRSWEGDAAPGFLHSLMLIVQQQQAIDEVSRACFATSMRRCTVQDDWLKLLWASRSPQTQQQCLNWHRSHPARLIWPAANHCRVCPERPRRVYRMISSIALSVQISSRCIVCCCPSLIAGATWQGGP